MKAFFFFFFGLFIGLWTGWPGLINPNNWKCFKDIINKSAKDEISLKATLAVSPNYLLKGKNKKNPSKIRIISDACFR